MMVIVDDYCHCLTLLLLVAQQWAFVSDKSKNITKRANSYLFLTSGSQSGKSRKSSWRVSADGATWKRILILTADFRTK